MKRSNFIFIMCLLTTLGLCGCTEESECPEDYLDTVKPHINFLEKPLS